jgi:flagellin FlaB
MLKRFLNHEKGITGLETAIILIAFVVVAAVFAYTALSAGLFSTQKSQEAVYAGLKEAQSTLEIRGGVIAIAASGQTGSSGNISQIRFVVGNVLGGEPIDFSEPYDDVDFNGVADSDSPNVVVINYQDDDQTKDDVHWTIAKLGNADDDDLLEDDERFEITIGADGGTGDLQDALTTDLSVKKTFNLEILTPGGATLNIERTTPAWIDPIMNLR